MNPQIVNNLKRTVQIILTNIKVQFTNVVFFVSLPLLLFTHSRAADTINWHQKDAVVWGRQQTLMGHITPVFATAGEVLSNGESIPFDISQDGSFQLSAYLHEGINKLVALADSSGRAVTSDTLTLTMGYNSRPEIYAFAGVTGRSVSLQSEVIENPDHCDLHFFWTADPRNPSSTPLTSSNEPSCSFHLDSAMPLGEYYFNLSVVSDCEDTVHVRTFVTHDSTGIHPCQIKTDHAAWIDRAIIYEITPYNFVFQGNFKQVKDYIPEIADLGVNTIWLQPVYQTHAGGQGYDVTDYFRVRDDYGTEEELGDLVDTIHAYGMRVLFDFVPGHTSIHHPYAQETIEYGELSHYYDYYKRDLDSAPYSMHYRRHSLGFLYYFWPDLPMLNYNHPEVKKWMIEAGKYWIEKYDIDGYRIDAVWGVNAKNPEFMKEWRLALKRIKPEILLLGEDKASWPMVFEERFDLAYDWTPEEDWISHWSWQTTYSEQSNPTIFNMINQNSRTARLISVLTNDGAGYHPQAKILRFMENNDTHRFLRFHDLERTKMTAAFMFALNGVPMLYNGQEIGAWEHPYDANFIFIKYRKIRSMDEHKLIPFYQHLIKLRKEFRSLVSDHYQQIPVKPDKFVYAFHRWQGREHIFGIMNMGDSRVNADIALPVESLALDSTKTWYLSDLLTGDVIPSTARSLKTVSVPMDAYSTRLYVLADSINVSAVHNSTASTVHEFTLDQNYPNPFNPVTQINYSISLATHVRLMVFDILGREVATLVDRWQDAGEYTLTFDGKDYPSGVYLYRLEVAEHTTHKKMTIVR